MKTALEPLDVIWEHAPSHKGIPGNKMAGKLAREGIEALPSTDNKGEESCMRQKTVMRNNVIFRCNTFRTTLKKLNKNWSRADGPQTRIKLLRHV